MQKDAIQQIQKSAHIVEILSVVENATSYDPIVVLPNDFHVENLEGFQKNRMNYRFNLKTDNLTDFIDYAQEYDQIGAKCFINASRMQATIIFDLGTETNPLHQAHKALLVLEKTAAYAKLLDINGCGLSQKEASEFIEDWTDSLFITDQSGASISNALAAKRLRDLTIEAAREVNSKVHDFGESMSAMERIEAKNQDTLPSDITFTCTPHAGLSEYEFTLRVGILTGSEKPKIVLRITQLEAKQEVITNEFKELLVAGFKDNELKTFIGSIG